MAFATVPGGKYYGWTAAQINTGLATLKAALIAAPVGQSAITSVSGNGMSVSYDPRAPGSVTIPEEIADLLTALALVDDDALPVTSEQVFAA